MRTASVAAWMVLLTTGAAGITRAGAGLDPAMPDLTGLSATDAVAVALERNRDIHLARAEVRRAGYQIIEARAGALPQINGSWNLDRNLRPMEFIMEVPDEDGVMVQSRLKIGTDYSSSLGISAAQPLYVGGKVGAALRGARIYRRLADKMEDEVRLHVVDGVLQAFNAGLLAREMEAIAAASLAQAEKHLEDVRARVDAGAATSYDLLRARVNVSNLRPGLIEARNSIRTALLQLKKAMGVDPETQVDIVGSFAAPDTSVLAQVDARRAMQRRPDIAVSRMHIQLQDEAVQIARADHLPTLSAVTTFSINGNANEFRYDRDDWSTYWLAGLNLSFPIFTGRRTTARHRQARIDRANAETGLRQAEDAVVTEIELATMSFRKALEQIDAQELTVGEAQEAAAIAKNLYANGKATQLEVLDVQLALEVARTNLAKAYYDGAIAQVALKKSLGLLGAGE